MIKIRLEFEEEDIPRLSKLFVVTGVGASGRWAPEAEGSKGSHPTIKEGSIEHPTTEVVPVPETAKDTTDPAAPTDGNGVLWNSEDHSTPAKLNNDGTWKKRRRYGKHLQTIPATQVSPPVSPQPPATAKELFDELMDISQTAFLSGTMSTEQFQKIPSEVGYGDMSSLKNDVVALKKAIAIVSKIVAETIPF